MSSSAEIDNDNFNLYEIFAVFGAQKKAYKWIYTCINRKNLQIVESKQRIKCVECENERENRRMPNITCPLNCSISLNKFLKFASRISTDRRMDGWICTQIITSIFSSSKNEFGLSQRLVWTVVWNSFFFLHFVHIASRHIVYQYSFTRSILFIEFFILSITHASIFTFSCINCINSWGFVLIFMVESVLLFSSNFFFVLYILNFD